MKKMISIYSFLIIISTLYSINVIENGILFEYDDENAQSIYLVGSMNDWDASATPMQKDDDGIWRILLDLDYGDYAYKFFVDGSWQVDQDNPNFEDDGYGGLNSIIKYNGSDNFDKKILTKSSGVESNFNPKIFFKGQYFSNNVFIENHETTY